MNAAHRIILWLTFILACFLPASALAPTASENCVWEIFSTGYDAPTTEATDFGSRTETSTSNYDTAPIHRATTGEIPTEANRTLFGPTAEFKAADAAGEAEGGVYLLRDAEGTVVRKGRTNDLVRREAEHALNPELKDFDFETVFRTDDYAEGRRGSVLAIDTALASGEERLFPGVSGSSILARATTS